MPKICIYHHKNGNSEHYLLSYLPKWLLPDGKTVYKEGFYVLNIVIWKFLESDSVLEERPFIAYCLARVNVINRIDSYLKVYTDIE